VRTVPIIALMMGAIHTSETSVYFNETTRRYILESCHLHTSHTLVAKWFIIYEKVIYMRMIKYTNVVELRNREKFFLPPWISSP
jgi:hypothetical protein